MDLLAAVFATVGAFLVTSKKKKRRLWGFLSFTVANTVWIGIAVFDTLPMGVLVQSCIFLLTAIIGIVNNTRSDHV